MHSIRLLSKLSPCHPVSYWLKIWVRAHRPETRENVCSEAAGPLLEFEPPTSHPSSSPSFLAPLIFPAADIDWILHAGFTLQEALGALHRVGGNADLALLVLLGKNTVVPTQPWKRGLDHTPFP